MAVLAVKAAAPLELGRRCRPHAGGRTGLDGLVPHLVHGFRTRKVGQIFRREVPAELGHDDARVHGVDGDPAAFEASAQLHRKQHVGRLGLAVSHEFVVLAPFEVDVVEVHAAEPVRAGAQIDDPRWRTGSKRRQQQKGQKKVT